MLGETWSQAKQVQVQCHGVINQLATLIGYQIDAKSLWNTDDKLYNTATILQGHHFFLKEHYYVTF